MPQPVSECVHLPEQKGRVHGQQQLPEDIQVFKAGSDTPAWQRQLTFTCEIPESVQETVDAISTELRPLPNLEGVTHGTSVFLRFRIFHPR